MTIKAQTGPGAEHQLSVARLVTLAAACLLIDDARLCGLLVADLGIDRARCDRIIGQGRAQGIVPAQEEIDATAIELMAVLGLVGP